MKPALEILDRIISESAKKAERTTDLLKPVEAASPGWFIYAPSFFNAALDILQTVRITKGQSELVWTQGPNFAFASGDTLYDSEGGYDKLWSDAIKRVNYCLSVTSAVDATPRTKDSPRTKGSVSFDLLVPDEQKVKLIKRECPGDS